MLPKQAIRLTLAVLFLISTILVPGCKAPEKPQEEPPNIPPEETFVMDYDAFSGSGSTAMGLREPQTKNNWLFAATQVAVWNTVLSVNLFVPVAAFRRALQETPEKQEDGRWLWSYNFSAFSTYTANLYGQIINKEVRWEMYISKEGVFADFLWYEGWAYKDNSAGNWQLHRNPQSGEDYLKIDWHRDVEADIADIKYTLISPDSSSYGSYIFYGMVPDSTYDRFYNIYGAQAENLVQIEWLATTRAGRIKDALHFSDAYWHYWDENLNDTEP